jgi:replicative DNA helicase
MSTEQLAMRLMSSTARIPSGLFRTGGMSSEQWGTLADATSRLIENSIYIDDVSGTTVAEMKGKLRRIKNLGLVVIDYLQLMSVGRTVNNRVQEISEITRNLKIMAKELDVPIILLSQLSRSPDTRADHRPVLSDLRESGSIEQDADIVLFLYRDAYYNKDSEESNIAECIIAKNRHGETNTIKLGWNGQFTQFSTLDVFRNEGQV